MSIEKKRSMRLIVNGKVCGDPTLRAAVADLRRQGIPLEVRVTWEAGDASHYAAEAAAGGVDVVIAAGGDGTVNEVANGLLSLNERTQTAVAVAPFGSANDFAVGLSLPADPLAAMQLAATGSPRWLDIGKVAERHFVNVASGGFGAEVTINTPGQIKRALGGAAYSLMGVVTAAKMNPYQCRFTTPDGKQWEDAVVILAVANGRQAGGGYQLAPQAIMNDGLLDVLVVHDVEMRQFGAVLSELLNIGAEDNQFVDYWRTPWVEVECDRPMTLSLDGEFLEGDRFRFEILHRALKFIVPADAETLDPGGD